MHCNWSILDTLFCCCCCSYHCCFVFFLHFFNNTTYQDKSTQKSGRKRGEIGNAVLLNCAFFFFSFLLKTIRYTTFSFACLFLFVEDMVLFALVFCYMTQIIQYRNHFLDGQMVSE